MNPLPDSERRAEAWGKAEERRRILGLIDDLQRNIQAQAKAQIAAGLPAERALSAQNEVLTLLSVAIGR